MATKKITEGAEKLAKKAVQTAEKVEAAAEKAVAKAKESPAVKKASRAATETAKKVASTTKKAASAAKKAVEKVTAYVEFSGKQISTAQIADKVREAYKASGNNDTIKTIDIYIKPEENAAYYVINGKADGSKIDL